MAAKETLFNYKGGTYLYVALFFSIVSIVIYFSHPEGSLPNGGTWQGYTLGGIAAFFILLLSTLGIRKRRYRSSMGTVKGWTSAHIYLGLSLLVIATLHCGFQFGFNVHTAAYALMVLVIVSGVWGLILYGYLPQRSVKNRSGFSRKELLVQLQDLNESVLEQLDVFPNTIQSLVLSAFKYTDHSTSLWSLFLKGDQSKVAKLDSFETHAKFVLDENKGQARLLRVLSQEATAHGNGLAMQQLIEVLAQRAVILDKLRKDAKNQGLLTSWLYVHVPLTFAVILALCVHVFSVFFYW